MIVDGVIFVFGGKFVTSFRSGIAAVEEAVPGQAMSVTFSHFRSSSRSLRPFTSITRASCQSEPPVEIP